MEGLLARERSGPGHERCPYCHDELGGAEPAELVTCAGCATKHHQDCLEELGRCSVMGCGAGALVPIEEARPPETLLRRQVRQRIRERVRRIARDLFTPVPTTPAPPLGTTGELGEALGEPEPLPRLPEPVSELPAEDPDAVEAAQTAIRSVRGVQERLGFVVWSLFAVAAIALLALLASGQGR